MVNEDECRRCIYSIAVDDEVKCRTGECSYLYDQYYNERPMNDGYMFKSSFMPKNGEKENESRS